MCGVGIMLPLWRQYIGVWGRYYAAAVESVGVWGRYYAAAVESVGVWGRYYAAAVESVHRCVG